MTEHRFLRSLFTITASSVLVGGSLLLLTSTAPWTRPPQSDPSTPDAMPIAAEPAIKFPQPVIDQARTSFSDDVAADDTITASTAAVPSPAEPETAQGTDAPSTEAGEITASGTSLDAANTDDASRDAVASEDMAVADAVAEPDSVAMNDASETETAALPEPQPSIAEDKTNAATDQIGDLLTDLPPRAIASDQSSAATGEVAAVLAATPPAPTATEDARPELAVMTPPPPMPARKPEDAPAAPKAVAVAAPPQEKPARPEESKSAPPQNVARQEPAQPAGKSQWQPMALAPADKPAVSSVPTARPSGPAYASKVWSALARHKPRAGQSGSTTVMFAIGENGALRGLKVGRSSGNSRIDQLALATVRGAAPFPPPPSGAASYSIRIDFH